MSPSNPLKMLPLTGLARCFWADRQQSHTAFDDSNCFTRMNNWKIKLLPKPVGITANKLLPRTREEMASFCSARNTREATNPASIEIKALLRVQCHSLAFPPFSIQITSFSRKKNQRLLRTTSWYELFPSLSNLRSGFLCKVYTLGTGTGIIAE